MQTPDPLQQLWQRQPTNVPSEAEIKRYWRKNRWQQWGYLLLDVVAWIVALVFIPKIVQKDLHLVEQIWIGSFLLIGVVFTLYFAWLRRFSYKVNVSTSDFVSLLVKQKQNDITIAKHSRNLMWFMIAAFVIWYPIYAYVLELSVEQLLPRLIKLVIFLAVFSAGLFAWANWLQRNSEKDLLRLQAVQEVKLDEAGR